MTHPIPDPSATAVAEQIAGDFFKHSMPKGLADVVRTALAARISAALADAKREALEEAAKEADKAIVAYLASEETEGEPGYPPFYLKVLSMKLRAKAEAPRG